MSGGYPLVPDPVGAATAAEYAGLVADEQRALANLAQALDRSFQHIWNPKAPATILTMFAACGQTMLARLQTHSALAAIVLAQEAANGIDSSEHPWAKPTTDNGVTTYSPSIPAGWTLAPILDASGNPTGAVIPTPAG